MELRWRCNPLGARWWEGHADRYARANRLNAQHWPDWLSGCFCVFSEGRWPGSDSCIAWHFWHEAQGNSSVTFIEVWCVFLTIGPNRTDQINPFPFSVLERTLKHHHHDGKKKKKSDLICYLYKCTDHALFALSFLVWLCGKLTPALFFFSFLISFVFSFFFFFFFFAYKCDISQPKLHPVHAGQRLVRGAWSWFCLFVYFRQLLSKLASRSFFCQYARVGFDKKRAHPSLNPSLNFEYRLKTMFSLGPWVNHDVGPFCQLLPDVVLLYLQFLRYAG